MAIKSRRAYKGAAVSNTLSTALNSTTDTTISVVANMSTSGWDTSGTPFFCVIDPGKTTEEKVCVKYSDTNTLTVVDPATTSGWSSNFNGRGVDNTTARAHDPGAVIYPVFTAYEANQANELVSKYASTGAMVYQDASTFATLALGTSGYPLLAGASAPAYGQVTATGIANDAVTTDKILNGAVTTDKILNGAVTTDKIATGAILDVDINASAAIALSKLATGALPTAITVASANVVNGSLLTTDFDTTTAVASGGVPVVTVSTSSATGGKNGDVWIVV